MLIRDTEAVIGCAVEERIIEMLRIFETLEYKGWKPRRASLI